MSENENEKPQGVIGAEVHSLIISKTITAENPDGRLNLQAPSDFLLCLGMLEWANEKLWAMYKAAEQQRKAGPKVQIPGLRMPPGQN